MRACVRACVRVCVRVNLFQTPLLEDKVFTLKQEKEELQLKFKHLQDALTGVVYMYTVCERKWRV